MAYANVMVEVYSSLLWKRLVEDVVGVPGGVLTGEEGKGLGGI